MQHGLQNTEHASLLQKQMFTQDLVSAAAAADVFGISSDTDKTEPGNISKCNFNNNVI